MLMTHTQDDDLLSELEQAVMARLSSRRPPKPGELVKDVASFVISGDPAEPARASVDAVLARLRRSGLVEDDRLKLTRAGTSALREALGVRRAPTWNQFCARLAARALGLPAGSEQARRALKTKDSIAVAVLRQRATLPAGANLIAICDVLVAETLGLPAGKLTLPRIRAHVLARRLGQRPSDDPMAVAASVLRVASTDKAAMFDALVRRGHGAFGPPRDIAVSPVLAASQDHALLELVREAIPLVGSDGRVGSEKVFVSALWHRIVNDGRASKLSLETFKHWLVHANRDQLLALERADAVGAMDARLVAESEIKSLGTTFHFVIDHHDARPEMGM
jgi:hypothetical protein